MELCQRSPFLPTQTIGVMTVNCQVGAQEEESSWFYSQVATALPADAASEQQQRASCAEKSGVRKALFSLQALRQNDTYDGRKHRGAE